MLHSARLGRSRRSRSGNAVLSSFGILTVLVAVLVLATTGQSSASHLPLHSCRDVSIRSYRVTHITTNYTCSHTSRILRRLLRRGVRGLPKRTTTLHRWGCDQVDQLHICVRYGSGSSGRITFEARKK